MSIAQNDYDFSATDRLGLALFTSILVHMVVILGITFSAPRITTMCTRMEVNSARPRRSVAEKS